MTASVSKGDAAKVGKITTYEEREFRVITPLPEVAPTAVTKSDILDFGEEGFLLHNLLTESECNHFITEGENAGFEVLPIVKERYRSSKR
ncbi:hypothetical protein C0Q70_13691 [Pomacea canaliculata]|uniref:Uncharacterized protein n=2 Tax=Pomacea canaliculata TaxID=400727 RepID=A0A2T7NY03_POMCA|nr:hypothetical protein C0Q70_13691 [Pomacea canaliculata]